MGRLAIIERSRGLSLTIHGLAPWVARTWSRSFGSQRSASCLSARLLLGGLLAGGLVATSQGMLVVGDRFAGNVGCIHEVQTTLLVPLFAESLMEAPSFVCFDPLLVP